MRRYLYLTCLWLMALATLGILGYSAYWAHYYPQLPSTPLPCAEASKVSEKMVSRITLLITLGSWFTLVVPLGLLANLTKPERITVVYRDRSPTEAEGKSGSSEGPEQG